MKKVLPVLFLLFCAGSFAQTIYPGNAKAGFGGTIGNGSLSISDNGTDITLNLTTANAFNDILVIYFNSEAGGFSNTTTIEDDSDGGRAAISGNSGANESEATFPAGFGADYGLAWGNFGSALFKLAAGGSGSLQFISFNSSTSSRTIPKTDIGITGAVNFDFIGTYISGGAYRSNEAIVENIGDGTESFGNFGFNPVSFSRVNVYTSGALNITLRNFAARRTAAAVALNWRVNCTGAYARFEVERSLDGRNFTSIHAERADAVRCLAPFDFTDLQAGNGRLMYRLKLISDGGKVGYSSIAVIAARNNGNNGPQLAVLPTVVTNSAMLQLNDLAKTNLNVRIVDGSGRILSSQRIQSDGGSMSLMLDVMNLRAGVYTVSVTDDGNQFSRSIRFVKQ